MILVISQRRGGDLPDSLVCFIVENSRCPLLWPLNIDILLKPAKLVEPVHKAYIG